MKNKLSSLQLIQHLKNRGVKFDITSEQEAKHFIEEHTYYFKLAAYRKNYDKFLLGDNAGKYQSLEFAYLKDLSRIDCHLRYLVLDMCLDIEHSLKIMLLHDIESNPNEDGYNIIHHWDNKNYIKDNVRKHLKTSYCSSLIKKYDPYYPAWVICELLSFGSLCKLISFYDKEYPKRLPIRPRLLFPIRDLRNAAAHSNCLINNVRERMPESKPSSSILKIISKIPSISQRRRMNALNNKPIHDFTAMLCLYPTIVNSEYLRKNRKRDLKKLIFRRMIRNRSYYLNNAPLTNAFIFVIQLYQNIVRNY
jgi:abortive infection bacteriophage resistance protein